MAQDLGLGGAGALGAAFGGAPRLREAAYAQERNQLARAFEAATVAQKNQSVTALNHARLDAQTSLADTFARAGMDPAQAQLAATAVIAASTSNPNQIIGAGQQLQAQGAGLGGDTQAMNVINSARTGKPLAMTKISGNTAFNPNVEPGAQNLLTTAVGKAMMGADAARAQASRASAGASGARTRLLDTQNTALLHPEKVPGASFNKPRAGGASPQDAHVIEGFRQRIAAGKATPEQVAAFLVQQGRPDLAKKIYSPSYMPGAMYDDGGE